MIDEVEKALECCTKAENPDCVNCPYRWNDIINRRRCDIDGLMRDALTLIKRQREEIARLTGKVHRLERYDQERDERLHARLTATARVEAVREFAEQMHSKVAEHKAYTKQNPVDKPDAAWFCAGKLIGLSICESLITNTAREMTEEQK